MKFEDRIECLREAWNIAKKTTHDYLLTQEKNEVEAVIDLLETINYEVNTRE